MDIIWLRVEGKREHLISWDQMWKLKGYGGWVYGRFLRGIKSSKGNDYGGHEGDLHFMT